MDASGRQSPLFENKEWYSKMGPVQFDNIIYHHLIHISEMHLILFELEVYYLIAWQLKYLGVSLPTNGGPCVAITHPPFDFSRNIWCTCLLNSTLRQIQEDLRWTDR